MSESVTRLGFDRSARILICVSGAFVGGGLGVAFPYLARWVSALPWVPFQEPLQWIGAFDSPAATVARPVIGLLLGAAVGVYVIYQSPVLDISSNQILVSERGNTRRIPRSDVGGIYRDGNNVVVESHQGRRLFRGEVEGNKNTIREVFVGYEYPWETE